MSSNVLDVACIGWCGGYGLAAISTMYKIKAKGNLAKWYSIAAKIVGYGAAIYVAVESLIISLT